MSPLVKMLLKALAAIACYGIFWGLTLAAFVVASSGDNVRFLQIVLVVLGVCGFIAVRHLPILFFSGGAQMQGLAYTIMFYVLRLLLCVFVGLFVAPWLITKKLMTFFPE